MSVEALSVCLHHSKAKGTAKLVLLGIANHAGDGGAWPSVATLARYANVTERNVQKALGTLAGLGEVRVHVQQGGLGGVPDFTRPNRYDVLVMCPPWCDRSAQHRDTRKRAGRQVALPVDKPGVDSDTPPPKQGYRVSDATPLPVSDATPEPSIEPGPNDVSASTTEAWPSSSERPPGLPPGVPPPSDQLAEVRDKLRAASDEHHRREQR